MQPAATLSLRVKSGQSTCTLSMWARAPDMIRSDTMATSIPCTHRDTDQLWIRYSSYLRIISTDHMYESYLLIISPTSTSSFMTTAPGWSAGRERVATTLLMKSAILMTGTVKVLFMAWLQTFCMYKQCKYI